MRNKNKKKNEMDTNKASFVQGDCYLFVFMVNVISNLKLSARRNI